MKLILTLFSSNRGKQFCRLIPTLIFIVLISLVSLPTLKAGVYSQGEKISISVEDIQLRDLFREIENNSEYAFFFNDQYTELNNKVSLDISTENISVLLDKLLNNTQLDFEIMDNNFIVIVPKADMQQVVLSGTVTDSNGSPLPGVNIIEKGTTNGVITDLDGNYLITVASPSSVLVFSYVGYNTEEMQVGSQTVLNMILIESLEELGEVVVIGYGTQRREAVTGSVGSIRGDEMREVQSSDVTRALQGRIAGVDLVQTSSKPGSSMQIRIRGTRSLTATNDPLIVLDGIPFAGTITDIDPNDIKSIDILKDASATAIYGSRGANGVIMISTNKGTHGQKAQLSYNSYIGFKQAIKYPMMDGPEFVKLREAAGRYDNGPDEFDTINTDWQDLFYRDAIVMNHDLMITGGTEHGSYNFGVGYIQDQSPIPSQQFTRYSLRGNIDQQIGKYLNFGFSSNNNYSLTEGEQIGLYGVLSATPIASPYNADGSLKRTIRMALDEPFVLTRDVVDSIGDSWISEKKGYGTYNNLYGEVKIPGIKGLSYRANIGLNLRLENRGTFTGEGVNSPTETNPSTASYQTRFTTNWIIENLLSFNRTFADKHQLNLVALYSTEETQYNKTNVSALDIPNPDFQYYNLGQALQNITVSPGIDPYDNGRPYQDYQKYGLISWMGRIIYSYDTRYMLTAALRSDGSSRLTEGHKWHTYPALSVGWNIGNESFMSNITFINLMKLRAGYGQTSNQAVEPYATLGTLETRPYNFGDQFATGYFVNGLPSDLGWEYSETYNYGLDFSLFGGRLSGTAEYYITNTKDLLLEVNLPPTAGAENVFGNIGKTKNEGVEFSLNGKILDNLNGWNWDIGFNLYHNKNTLVALASGVEEDEANWWFVGYPINVVYDYEYVGLWQEDEADIIDSYESGGNVGMIKVRYTGDFNEDGTPVRRIGSDDRIPLPIDPDFQGGFNTNVSYKGFDLGIVGTFKKGGMLVSTLHSASGYLDMLTGRRNNVQVDYWTPENTDAHYPAPNGLLSGDNPKYGSTLGYFDASYLKIRALTLGYSLDRFSWIRNAGISQLRIYFTAQNPLVMFSPFHKESGLDPESNSYGNENAAVNSVYRRRILTIGTNTPSTRNYLIGINVTL